jgi:hypothetical protein
MEIMESRELIDDAEEIGEVMNLIEENDGKLGSIHIYIERCFESQITRENK